MARDIAVCTSARDIGEGAMARDIAVCDIAMRYALLDMTLGSNGNASQPHSIVPGCHPCTAESVCQMLLCPPPPPVRHTVQPNL